MKSITNILAICAVVYIGYHIIPYFTTANTPEKTPPAFVMGDFVQVIKIATVEQDVSVTIDTTFEVNKNWINEQVISEMFSFNPCVARLRMIHVYKILVGFNLKNQYSVIKNDTTRTATIIIAQPSILSVENDYAKESDLTTDNQNEPTPIYNKRYVKAAQMAKVRQYSRQLAINKAIENGIFGMALSNLQFVRDYLQQLNPDYTIMIKTL